MMDHSFDRFANRGSRVGNRQGPRRPAACALAAGTCALALLPLPAKAQEDEPSASLPADIVVTGERVKRGKSETAASVGVATDETLDARSIHRLDDLLASVPNIQPGSGEEGPTIRGQDSTGQLRSLFAFLGGARPRVTLQIDGRPASFYEFISGSEGMWDVAQVEVFRSPQTTTQGRNAIAGAIFVETEDPRHTLEGRGRLTIGELGVRQASAAVSIPIAKDELAIRLSGDIRAAHMSSDLADGIDGANIDRDDYGTVRLKLLYEPRGLPGARFETSVAHSQSQAPQFEAVTAPFEERRAPVPDRTNGIMRVNVESITTRGTVPISPQVEASLMLSLGNVTLRRFGLPGLGTSRADTEDFSAELNLVWRPTDALMLRGGVHRLGADQIQSIDLAGLMLGQGKFDDRQDSLGLFGEATVQLAPKLSLNAGLRYQRDSQRRTGGVGPIVIDYDESFDALLPKLGLTFSPSEDISLGVLAQRAFNPGGTSISLFRRAPESFTSESLWNYEIFLRSSLADGALIVGINAFFNDIRDAQRQQLGPLTLQDGSTIFVPTFSNAPAAKSYGLEGEMTWKLSRDFLVSAGLGLLETEVTRTSPANDPTLGKDFQRSPHLSANGLVEWQANRWLTLSANVRHHGGYFSDDRNTPNLRVGPATIIGARAVADLGPVELFAYGRNLTNALDLTYLFSPTAGAAGDPREFGMGIEARF